MNKDQAITKLEELDNAYSEKMDEGKWWANEYHLAGTSSPYRKASEKPAIEAQIQKAYDERQAIWAQMVELMEEHGIDALSEVAV